MIKNIKKIMEPNSIAVIGVSSKKSNLGNQFAESILSSGYQGKIYLVHPKNQEVYGIKTYQSLSSIGKPVDLAIIALNPILTIKILEECGKLGIPSAICASGGFGELGNEGKELGNKLYHIAKEWKVEIVGPNTFGIINMEKNLNATFGPMDDLIKGKISMLSQSGGIGLSFLQECINEGIGINKWIGVGNRGTLEFSNYLNYLEKDEGTDVIAIYLEGTEKPREFIEIANKISQNKPIIVYMVGRTDIAKEATLTHTGSMAGHYKLYSDIFEQFGLLKANSLIELVMKCKALSLAPLPNGPRVGIITMTYGPGIVAVDELIERKGTEIKQFSNETLSALQKTIKDRADFFKNPLDIAPSGFDAVKYGKIVDIVLRDPKVDILLAIYAYAKNWRFPTIEIIDAFKKYHKPIICCYISTKDKALKEMNILHENGIPVYLNIESAVMGISGLIEYQKTKHKK